MREKGRSRGRKRGGDRGRSGEGMRGRSRARGSRRDSQSERTLRRNSGARSWFNARGLQRDPGATLGRGGGRDASTQRDDKRSATKFVPYLRRRSPRKRSAGNRRRQGGARRGRDNRDTRTGPINMPSPPMTGRPQGNHCSRLGSRKVYWADRHGGHPYTPLEDRASSPRPFTSASRQDSSISLQQTGKNLPSASWTPHGIGPRTYKEAMLSSATPTSTHERTHHKPAYLRAATKRCFRCLSSDHLVRYCRDPVRCSRCSRTGHRARLCPSRQQQLHRPSMQRYRGFRPVSLKAFIPLSEDFHIRHNQCKNAVLADVTGRSNLGHFPQATIAADLAARFGGFPTDFLVATYRPRDYVIILPEWVNSDSLTNCGLLRLHHCRLNCFPWDPNQHAEHTRLSYKAWIKIMNLPFECWSSSLVSAIVGGFGRFLHADDNSVNILDMTGFRCQVAVLDLADIPEHLTISLGDVVVTVPVRIENTAQFGGNDHGIPFVGGGPSEGGDQTDPQGSRLARRIALVELRGASSDSREGARTGESDTWNSEELRDRRRSVQGTPAQGAMPSLTPSTKTYAIHGGGPSGGSDDALCPAVPNGSNAVAPRAALRKELEETANRTLLPCKTRTIPPVALSNSCRFWTRTVTTPLFGCSIELGDEPFGLLMMEKGAARGPRTL